MHRTRTLALILLSLGAGSAAAQSPPALPGLARPGLSPVDRGLVLLGELGCASCHDAAARGRAAPDLSRVGRRVLHPYLRAFIADPHATKPGTAMPDVMRGASASERADAADKLTRFLLSLSPDAARPEAVDPDAARRGFARFHEIGCAACHLPRNERGDAQADPDSVGVPLSRLAEKYSVRSLIEFLDAPRHARPAGRMPDFELSPAELRDISHYLLQGAEAASGFEPLAIDADAVAAGRALFGELACASCHAIGSVRPAAHGAKPIHALRADRGCLSGQRGAWPFFALSPEQRRDIAAALAARDAPDTAEREIRRTLAAFNCIACHQRGDFGGVAADRNELFESHDLNLGESGRLPPPLTGVGAKLQPDWLRDAIAYGQRIRGDYMKTRMPGFGEPAGARLAKLFGAVDELPEAPIAALPENRKEARAVRDIGHQLTGNKGLNCIACHTFAGHRPEAMAAVDLVESTGRRLQPRWFYHYMLEPVRFRAEVVMPQFFPGGNSARPDIADGDVARQLTGLWHYLAQGRNTRAPSGLVRPAIEIEVGDEAVMLRRSVQNTGKRGISVGYPGGVNVTFDAESLALNQIWWGKFIDARAVWGGQGSGQARILSRDRVDLGRGPALAPLAGPTAPWPAATADRRELGHEFLGYDLDDAQRPTFRYRCHGVEIRDKPREIAGSGQRPVLRRTMRFAGETGTTLFLRLVRDAAIEDLGGGRIRIGKLVLQLPAARYRVRDAAGAEGEELIVEVALREGAARLEIDYVFGEEKAP